jgi:hypothetical protein
MIGAEALHGQIAKSENDSPNESCQVAKVVLQVDSEMSQKISSGLKKIHELDEILTLKSKVSPCISP